MDHAPETGAVTVTDGAANCLTFLNSPSGWRKARRQVSAGALDGGKLTREMQHTPANYAQAGGCSFTGVAARPLVLMLSTSTKTEKAMAK
jgi:hypothetical protein